MIIEHTDGRRVEGVTLDQYKIPAWMREGAIGEAFLHTWIKNGVRYFPGDGWREVQETKRVDVTGECNVDALGNVLHHGLGTVLRNGYHHSIVTRHHLPEDIDRRWTIYKTNCGGGSLIGFLKPFKCPVIIIEKDQP